MPVDAISVRYVKNSFFVKSDTFAGVIHDRAADRDELKTLPFLRKMTSLRRQNAIYVAIKASSFGTYCF